MTKSTLIRHPNAAAIAGNVVRSTSAEFLIGSGSGIENSVSAIAVGTLGRLYHLLGQNEANQHYTNGSMNPSAFHTGDFSVLTRFEDVGADPWHVLLVLATVVILGVGIALSRREWRVPLVLAIAACVGFAAFTGTARWSIYDTRYYIPLLVLWTPLIATALSRFPRIVPRLVAVFLVLACLPQLFDNYTRSLIHPAYHFSSFLQPYFVEVGDSQTKLNAQRTAQAYEGLTKTIAKSSCQEVGLSNLVTDEYPIWVGLSHYGWKGTMDDVDVHNATASLLPPDFSPCALIAQRSQRNYVGHVAGMQTAGIRPTHPPDQASLSRELRSSPRLTRRRCSGSETRTRNMAADVLGARFGHPDVPAPRPPNSAQPEMLVSGRYRRASMNERQTPEVEEARSILLAPARALRGF